MPSPCSPECEPLYSRTMAKASSAIARIALHVLVEPQVEHRPHMQAADRGMRVPGAARAVLREDLGEPRRVVGEMRAAARRNPRRRRPAFPRSFIDIMMLRPGGAHLRDRRPAVSGSSTSTTPPHWARSLVPAETEIADQLAELAQPAHVLGVVLGELDEQDRFGIAAQERFERRLEHRDLARQSRSWCDRPARPRSGFSLTMCWAASIACIETAEMADADGAAAEQRPELQFDRGRKGERAFRADQNMREIDAGSSRDRARRDCSRRRGAAPSESAPRSRRPRAAPMREQVVGAAIRIARPSAHRLDRPRPRRNAPRAVGQDRVDRQHVVAHGAVAQRARRRRNCCPPCRRWWRARRSRCRPETTARAASAGG